MSQPLSKDASYKDIKKNISLFSPSELASVSENQHQNIDKLNEALIKEGIDLDGTISKEQISFFLDRHSKNGNFNQNLKDKIFKALYSDEAREIPVRDFVINFSALASELRKALTEYERRNRENNENLQKLKDECSKYQNERMNEEISEFASFRITFLKVEFKKSDEADEGNFFNLAITLYSDSKEEETYNTNLFGINSTIINEEFTFKPKTRNDSLILQLFSFEDENMSGRQTELGQVELSLSKMQSQEEFELDLLIPDISNQNEIKLTVKAKAIFIWSQYEYFQNQIQSKEEMKRKIEAILLKTRNFYDALNNLEFFEDSSKNYASEVFSGGFKGIKSSKKNENLDVIPENKADGKQFQNFADSVDNMVSTRLNGKKVNWIKINLILAGVFLLLNFFTSFIKSEMLNFLLGGLCLLDLFSRCKMEKKHSFTLKFLIYAFGLSFAFDLIWLFVCGGNCFTEGPNSTAKKVTFFLNLVNIVVKGGLFVGFLCMNSSKN